MTPSHRTVPDESRTIQVPTWLAVLWLRLREERLHGSLHVNFTHGREANVNVTWSIFPKDGKR